jgi:hypothetical protein
MVEENEKIDAKLWLKSSLGVAALSIVGYLLGFAYEKGYAEYFGIPVQLIKLNLVSIFIIIVALSSLLWFLLLITNAGYMIFSERPGVIFRGIIRSAPSLLFCAAVFYIYGNTSWHILKWLILWPALTFFGEFVWPLITQRGKGTYFQKLEAQEKLENHWQSKTFWGLVAQRRGGLITLRLILTAWILFLLAYWIGMAEAQRQKNFLVVKEPMPLVVLRIYGDKFVCAPFDSKARTVEKELYILDTLKQDGLWLDWQQVGPLKPVDKKVQTEENK